MKLTTESGSVGAVGAECRLDGGIKILLIGGAYYGLFGFAYAECHQCGRNKLQRNGWEKERSSKQTENWSQAVPQE